MLAKAIAHYETAGRAQALADFTARKAPFADRDLYVSCFSADRRVASHGGDPKQVGVVFDTLKDVDGKAFGAAIWDAGIKPASGQVEYKWQNPVTGAVEAKVSFVRKAGNDVCGVGAYAASKYGAMAPAAQRTRLRQNCALSRASGRFIPIGSRAGP